MYQKNSNPEICHHKIHTSILYLVGGHSLRDKSLKLKLPIEPPNYKQRYYVDIQKMRKKKHIDWEIEEIQIINKGLSQDKRNISKKISPSSQSICSINPILISFQQISFPYLKRLLLASNDILSLQGFSSIRAPFLRELDLNSNKIVDFSDLRKNSLYTLTKFSISNNPATALDTISELTCQNLRVFTIQYKNRDRQISSDINFLAKFLSAIRRCVVTESSIKGCAVYLKSANRIQPNKIKENKEDFKEIGRISKSFECLIQIAEKIEMGKEAKQRRMLLPGIMFQCESDSDGSDEGCWVPVK